MPGTNGFHHEQLSNALFELWDAFDRAMIQMFVVGDIAVGLHNNTDFTGSKVRVIVQASELNPFALDVLTKTLGLDPKEDKKWKLESSEGVPMEIKINRKNLDILKTPEEHMYLNEVFLLPNPFDEYVNKYKFL